MGEKRVWGAPRGNQGSISSPVDEIVKQNRADSERRRMEMKDEEERLQHEAKKKDLEKHISGEAEAQQAQMAQENEQLKEKVHEKEVEAVRVELGGKIDQLSRSIKEGASQKSIGEQISEIKQAATDMGLGGSKYSEFQEMMDAVDRIRPTKTLPEQLKDAQEVMEALGKEKTDQLSPEISLKMKEMDRDLQIRLEEMRDGRSDRDRDWQLRLKQWEEEREDKKTQIMGEIQAKKEGNALLASGIERLGEVLAAAKGAGVGAAAGAAAGAIAASGSRVIAAGEGDAGETECPSCHTVIPISESDTDVICAGCGTRYTIERIPKTTEEGPPVVAAGKGKKK